MFIHMAIDTLGVDDKKADLENIQADLHKVDGAGAPRRGARWS